MNIIQFIDKYSITIKSKSIASRDDGLMADMDGARHWECSLKRPCEGSRAKSLKITFTQGSGHTAEPTAYDLLSCILADVSGLRGTSNFRDWASEFGFDDDSISAKKTYKALLKQHDRVCAYLENGPDDSAYLDFIAIEDDGDDGVDSYRDDGAGPFPVWQHRYVARENGVKVVAGLHYIEGNTRPYFSVTGSATEEILAAFPRLAPVVALHLADDSGVPMHAIANALYHLGVGKDSSKHPDRREHFRSHLRLADDEVRTIRLLLATATGYSAAKDVLTNYVEETLKPRWQAEATAAITLLEELIAEQNS